MKQIVLPLASRFPAGHLKGGQLTGFPEKVIKGTKIHTFREDPGKWAYNVELINSHNAELSIRRWIGRPYHTPQLEVKRLKKIGIPAGANDMGLRYRAADRFHRRKTYPKRGAAGC